MIVIITNSDRSARKNMMSIMMSISFSYPFDHVLVDNIMILSILQRIDTTRTDNSTLIFKKSHDQIRQLFVNRYL